MSEFDAIEEVIIKEEPTDWEASCLIPEDIKPTGLELNGSVKIEVNPDVCWYGNRHVEPSAEHAGRAEGTSTHSSFELAKVQSPRSSTKHVEAGQYGGQKDKEQDSQDKSYPEESSTEDETGIKTETFSRDSAQSDGWQYADNQPITDRCISSPTERPANSGALNKNTMNTSPSQPEHLFPAADSGGRRFSVVRNSGVASSTFSPADDVYSPFDEQSKDTRHRSSSKYACTNPDQEHDASARFSADGFPSGDKVPESHSGTQRYPCNACAKTYSTKGSLTVHLRTHSNERPYTCPHCGKSYSQRKFLASHLRSHSAERSFKCDKCVKSYRHNSSLITHLRSHSGERPYSCVQCRKAFYDSSTLKKHLGTHTGERPHSCKLCGKSFTRGGTLTVHMQTHSGESPHVCGKCGKAFQTRNYLKAHLHTHSATKRYTCNECGNSFTQKLYLSRHLQLHLGECPCACKVCGSRFLNNRMLARHMVAHAGCRTHACQPCGRSFSSRKALAKHECARSLDRAGDARKSNSSD